MNESALQLIMLLRFLCFMAVFYLMLHILFARLICRPDSKVLWFFSVFTAPFDLGRFVSGLQSGSIRLPTSTFALFFYGVLWLLFWSRRRWSASTLH